MGEAILALARDRKSAILYATARELLEADVAQSPGSYLKANALGGLLYEVGDHADASRVLQQAVALNPVLATTRFNLGLALEKQGRVDEAAAAYEEAARLDPAWAKPREKLAALRAQRGSPK
jgi:tetratricopeptide (TPR) repeat protein